MRKILFVLGALAASAVPALAGDGTITSLDAGSVPRTFGVATDGGGNFFSKVRLCDGAACAAYGSSTSNGR